MFRVSMRPVVVLSGAESVCLEVPSSAPVLDAGAPGWLAVSLPAGARPHLRRQASWLLALVAMMLVGCAHNVALTKQSRAALHSVSVRADVQLPQSMYYSGQKDTLAAGFLSAGGVVGSIAGSSVAGNMRRSASEALLAEMRAANIAVDEIVRQEFEAALDSEHMFAERASTGGDAEFVLTVNMYGLAQKGAFAAELRPLLNVTGSLVRPDGTVVWKDSAFITNLSKKTRGSTLDGYLAAPEELRRAFTEAATLVAKELVAELAGR